MVYKPCTLSKALKEKSKGEDNSLAASIADEAFGLFLELMVSSFFTPMRSKHCVLSSNFRKSAKPSYVVTFSTFCCYTNESKSLCQVSGYHYKQTNMAGDNRGTFITLSFFEHFQWLFLIYITWLDSKVLCAVLVKKWLNYVCFRRFVLSS